jgi:hypothetical protein
MSNLKRIWLAWHVASQVCIDTIHRDAYHVISFTESTYQLNYTLYTAMYMKKLSSASTAASSGLKAHGTNEG